MFTKIQSYTENKASKHNAVDPGTVILMNDLKHKMVNIFCGLMAFKGKDRDLDNLLVAAKHMQQLRMLVNSKSWSVDYITLSDFILNISQKISSRRGDREDLYQNFSNTGALIINMFSRIDKLIKALERHKMTRDKVVSELKKIEEMASKELKSPVKILIEMGVIKKDPVQNISDKFQEIIKLIALGAIDKPNEQKPPVRRAVQKIFNFMGDTSIQQ